MHDVLLLSLTAALNPTLLTATTVMLLLPNPRRLLLGYWLGAMLTSVTLGVLIVLALQDTGAVSTTKRTVSPLATMALGLIALLLALALGTGRDRAVTARRARNKADKGPPRWQQTLNRGSLRATFVVGALLTLPGASYLAGLTRLSRLDYAAPRTILAVIAFNLVMLVLLEGPLIAFAVAPDWTVDALARGKEWAAARGRYYAARALALVGAALVLKGIVELV